MPQQREEKRRPHEPGGRGPPARPRPLIVFERATVRVPGLPGPVLEGIDLSVRSGKLLALIGPSGSGKSTLLKAACGLVSLDSGSITVDGDEVSGASEEDLVAIRHRIGMLFQQGALFDRLTVLQNTAFPLLRRGWSEEEARRRALDELERVGLADASRLLPSELSGGMRKRVGIARALVTDPPVALYDEPVAGLDPVTGSRILALLRRACDERGVAGVVVGHEVGALLPVCDEAAVLIEGRLVHSGVADLLPRCEHPAVRQLVTGSLEGPL